MERLLDNNHYFETLERMFGEINEDVLTRRINECERVLNELATTNAWKIVIDDAQKTVRFIDDNWQALDPKSSAYEKARITKLASKQVMDLPKEYLHELETLQDKLKELQNPDTIIEKDADNEM